MQDFAIPGAQISKFLGAEYCPDPERTILKNKNTRISGLNTVRFDHELAIQVRRTFCR